MDKNSSSAQYFSNIILGRYLWSASVYSQLGSWWQGVWGLGYEQTVIEPASFALMVASASHWTIRDPSAVPPLLQEVVQGEDLIRNN